MSSMADSLPWSRPAARAEPRARLRLLGQVVACALVLLCLGEGIARGVLTSPSRQTFDAELGFRYLPGSEFFDGSEGGARLRLNSLGLNDNELGPKGTRPRVAVVGDSMTMAYQVEREDNYVSRLARLRPELEFVNVSQADMGPVEYGVLLRRHQAALAPDRVLLAFSYGDVDDVRRNPPAVERGPDGAIARLIPAASSRQGLKARIEPFIQRSALATVLMRRFGATFTRFAGGGGAAEPVTLMSEDEVAEIIAFVLGEAAVQRPVAAMFLPQREYKADRHSRMDALSARDATVVARAAELAGVLLHIAEDDLARDYEASGQPGQGFANLRIGSGHLNPAGHEAVARGLAGFLPRAFTPAAER